MSSRVSTKIQQLLNTLKRPKRPPLSEFFTDDSEEIVEGIALHKASIYAVVHHGIFTKTDKSVTNHDSKGLIFLNFKTRMSVL